MIRFDAVWLDAGGVLVLPDPTVLGPLLAWYGGSTDVERHRRAHHAAMAVKSVQGAEERDWRDYDRAYTRAVDVPDDDVEEAAAVLGGTRTAALWRYPIADSQAALVALAAAGVPLGVVSNASGQIEHVLRRGGVCQVGPGAGVDVRCVVDSEVVGVAKPDPAIFDHAAVHFPGVARPRIAYVGDSVTMDVGGARAAGLHPILFDPYDDHAGVDFERIRSLGELLAITSGGGR
ncbi:MAG: HAD family hydrolase [Ilumatobacteraceae bacterium]